MIIITVAFITIYFYYLFFLYYFIFSKLKDCYIWQKYQTYINLEIISVYVVSFNHVPIRQN